MKPIDRCIQQVRVRPAEAGDMADLAEIYKPVVIETAITFDIEAPDAAEMSRRWRGIIDAGWPYLVAEDAGVVCGYASVRRFKEKAAFAWTGEVSIYVSEQSRGRGVGLKLLQELIAASDRIGLRQLVALIAAGQSAASVALHKAAGFEQVGLLRSAGFKHGHWHDVIYMQRAVGAGATSAPD